MTHTQTQGADGAGTKTAKPGDLLYRSEWETKRTITHEDAREIAGRLIASHFRRTDCETARASIPANPDYDDDLLINSYIKQQARKEAALATPAPATTPGVPDSLRALSEVATQGKFKAIRSVWGFILVAEEGDPKGCLSSADADFAVAAVNHVRALIAAQPAGQAGDAGAARTVEFMCEGQVCTAEVPTPIPAPNSTRTGAAETELTEPVATVLWYDPEAHFGEKKPHKIIDASMAFMDAAEIGTKLYTRPLAARPEAPSDAGWNFDMEAAPQDGTRILLWMHGCWIHPVIGYRAPSAPGSQRDCWREHGSRARIHRVDCWRLIPAGPTPPSDPAPSDAGWSFDMEAAPRDGTPINVGRDNGCGWDLLVVWWSKSASEYPWHTEGGGEYPEHRFDCWATLTPPSDPAPSGQAEG